MTGHTSPVERVRFQPHHETVLCTAASDSSVRLWDVRSASQQNLACIDVHSGTSATDIAWSPSSGVSILAVTERNGSVYIYDTRKLPPSSFGGSKAKAAQGKNGALLHTFPLTPSVVEACIFSPAGHHLVAATTNEGLGELTAWNWENKRASSSDKFVYPAHTGPIYSLTFSPDGKRLATGGSDAIVGLWDVDSMVCTQTITRLQKFTRSVAFSHDSQLIATASEEDGIDLGSADTGDLVGKVGLGRKGGADEICFHPKGHILACARCPSGMGGVPSAVTVAKLNIIAQ